MTQPVHYETHKCSFDDTLASFKNPIQSLIKVILYPAFKMRRERRGGGGGRGSQPCLNNSFNISILITKKIIIIIIIINSNFISITPSIHSLPLSLSLPPSSLFLPLNVQYLKNIIPILDIVAGDAHERLCVSNKKLTFGPNCIRSPEGIVRSLLSSRTEFKDSIHSGSMSPSHMIHECMSESRTTCLALDVRTPSVHSLVSRSI